jgi:hypothetical protein
VPRVLSLGVKRLWREADQSPSTGAEVKKIWIYYIHSPICLNTHSIYRISQEFGAILRSVLRVPNRTTFK